MPLCHPRTVRGSIKFRLLNYSIGLTICAATLLLSSGLSLAQTPTPTPTPCPGNGQVNPLNEETLAWQYQPYGVVLKRYRFVPPGDWPPNTTFPTVLMVPPDIFHDDDTTDGGEPHEKEASKDLQDAGFLVFQVETRLSPPGKLPLQASSDAGTAPEQTDDLKRQILAALADPQCNGKIYLVGGSAGGCLALWCALDPASTVTGWNETARAHIKAVVSCSGPTNFCKFDMDSYIPQNKVTLFEYDLDEYVGLDDGTDCDSDPMGLLDHASPYWLVTNGATSNPPPIMLYTTLGDHVPYYDADDMWTALSTHYGISGHDFEEWKMNYAYGSGYEHAFHYWHQVNNVTGSDGLCVSEEVINFLDSYL
jgi:dienelactone hydrolase